MITMRTGGHSVPFVLFHKLPASVCIGEGFHQVDKRLNRECHRVAIKWQIIQFSVIAYDYILYYKYNKSLWHDKILNNKSLTDTTIYSIKPKSKKRICRKHLLTKRWQGRGSMIKQPESAKKISKVFWLNWQMRYGSRPRLFWSDRRALLQKPRLKWDDNQITQGWFCNIILICYLW